MIRYWKWITMRATQRKPSRGPKAPRGGSMLASARHVWRTRRKALAAGLVLALAAPFTVWAAEGFQSQSAEGQEEAQDSEQPQGVPFWKELRSDSPASEEGEEEDGEAGGEGDGSGESEGDPQEPEPQVRRWTDENLNAVHFPTATVGYAVGDNATVLKTTDRGDTWRVWRLSREPELTCASPPRPCHLYGVHFVDEQAGVVVGERGVVLRTKDGGETWVLVRAPGIPEEVKNATLRGVHFATPKVGYAVGDRVNVGTTSSPLWRYTLLKTEDAGLSWRRLKVVFGSGGSEVGGRDLRAVHFAGPDGDGVVDGVAVGMGVLKPEADGPDWRELFSNGDFRGAVLLEAKGVGYAVGGSPALGAPDSVYRTEDGFKTQHRENTIRHLRGVTAYRVEATAEPSEGPDEPEEPPEEPPDQEGTEIEVVHAVGFERVTSTKTGDVVYLPVALTRYGEERKGQPPHDRPWVAEPIEGWDRHKGRELLAVSASPGGGTVVGVGTEGLMLRRATDTEEAIDALCAPRDLADELGSLDENGLLDDRVPVCPEPGQAEEPEGKTPSVAPPPSIAATPARGTGGAEFTVEGKSWLACEGRPACEGSTVTLSFRQGSQVFPLDTVRAGADGTFSRRVTVPEQAAVGGATVRAEGAPVPDGGPSAEQHFLVPAVTISAIPNARYPGDAFTIRGDGWHACQETAGELECAGSTVELSFQQATEQSPLVEEPVKAAADGSFVRQVSVPKDAVPGAATVRAVAKGQPAPDGGLSAQAEFQVWTGCGVRLDQTNPEFPCLTDVELLDEGENPVSSSGAAPYFDPGLGEDGRAVIVSGSRVHLYDLADRYLEVVSVAEDLSHATVKINDETYDRAAPGRALAMGFVIDKIGKDEKTRKCVTFRKSGEPTFDVCEGKRVQQGLRQRGVPGFGRHFTAESANGETTGVINLEHAEIRGDRAPVLDTERHRLYFFGGRQLPDLSSARNISVVSLTGEFPPRTFNFDDEFLPGDQITRLGVDAPNGMLYVATTAGTGGIVQFVATTTPQRDVHIHAIRVRVVGEGDDAQVVLDHRWSLNVGDLCPTVVKRTHGLWVSRKDGRLLSLPCQGTDFSAFGNPQASPNGILTLTLPPGKSPRDLVKDETRDDTVEFGRGFEVVPGGGQGALSRHQVNGDQAARVLTWQIGNLLLVWDLDEGMWIGALQTRGGLVAADPASRRLYLDNGDALTLFQVTNLPGSTERTRVPVGFYAVLPGGAFDPRTRRLVVHSTAPQPLRVLEDRIAPPIAFSDPSPDSRTHDLDEEEAFSVDRRGATAAYGARVWWTGLKGTLPGQYDGITSGGSTSADGPGPPPGLTWDWLVYGGPNNPLGARLSTLPWRPHESPRELFSARVEDASLSVQSSAFSDFVSGLSRAVAWGLDIDDGPPSSTGEDLRSRRGAREWRELAALQVETFCDNFSGSAREDCRKRWSGDPNDPDDGGFKAHWDRWYHGQHPDDEEELDEDEKERREQENEFRADINRLLDRCTLEFYDRAFREVDGQRREDFGCFSQFDRDKGINEREGMEQRTGLTQRARCADPDPESAPESSTGPARVSCDLLGGMTRAGAEGGLGMEFPGGVTLRVEGAVSNTRSFLDPARGMVSVAEALAQGIEVSVEGMGKLRIGQVATRAETWAKGRPGTAGSDYKVGYSNVAVTTADGQVLFSCDPHGDLSLNYPHKDKVDAPAAALAAELRQAAAEASKNGAPSGLTDGLKQLADEVEAAPDRRASGELRKLANDVEEADPELAGHLRALADNAETLEGSQAPNTGCDPRQIETAVGRVFGGVIGMVAPARDTDPRMMGTPGGAQAVVRRNRRGYWNDRVLFPEAVRDELPGLQLTISGDGTEFNRYRVDLAAVYAASTYYIGQEAEALPEDSGFPGTEGTPGTPGTPGTDAYEEYLLVGRASRTPAQAPFEGGWWQRIRRGLEAFLRSPWQALALALLMVMVATPGYLAARRRELSLMRGAT